MADPQSNDFLEIYKLHAELADRVSQRREGTNRLYAGLLLTALVAFTTALLKFDPQEGSMTAMFIISGIMGLGLSLSWCILIRSYRQLNRGKFKALHEIEKELPFQFFKREWELLKEGKDYRRYWKLTVVETALPIMFGLLSLSIILLLS